MNKCNICNCDKTTILEKNMSKKHIVKGIIYTDKVTEIKCTNCGNLLYGSVIPITDGDVKV